MKTLLIAVLSGIFAVAASAESDREAMDEAYEWVERESERQEARADRARQQDALDDIRWEMAQRRQQAQQQAAVNAEQARRQRARLLEQQWAERQQRANADACRRRRAR